MPLEDHPTDTDKWVYKPREYNLGEKHMMTDQIKDDIEIILDEFDFEKVRKVMEFLNWKWGDNVPTIGGMRRVARQLLKEVVESSLEGIVTGGFQVRKRDGGDKTILSLEFVVTSWDNYE